ncbi:hypothetical protein HOLleu_24488 [Holothuria leucospilota]|uniref:Uncharacterized protein n=1 Tax=Holothuria leucospilota TaxID=206669 RepID=A0A9Q1H6C4_HOLLE|nr:hypothetical protein HOLleu_24488 [Holothuria leucospilota]
MMLLLIFFVYFWLQFHCGLTAVVDSAVGQKDVQPQTEEHLNFLTEFQKKLQEIEETQEFLMSKIKILLSSEEKTPVDQKRIRRETEEQAIPTSHDNHGKDAYQARLDVPYRTHSILWAVLLLYVQLDHQGIQVLQAPLEETEGMGETP